MSDSLLSDAELMSRLAAYPGLRSRVEALVLAVEDETGEFITADAAELHVIQLVRQTGHQALQSWAETQVERRSKKAKTDTPAWHEGKKNSAGTRP